MALMHSWMSFEVKSIRVAEVQPLDPVGSVVSAGEVDGSEYLAQQSMLQVKRPDTQAENVKDDKKTSCCPFISRLGNKFRNYVRRFAARRPSRDVLMTTGTKPERKTPPSNRRGSIFSNQGGAPGKGVADITRSMGAVNVDFEEDTESGKEATKSWDDASDDWEMVDSLDTAPNVILNRGDVDGITQTSTAYILPEVTFGNPNVIHPRRAGSGQPSNRASRRAGPPANATRAGFRGRVESFVSAARNRTMGPFFNGTRVNSRAVFPFSSRRRNAQQHASATNPRAHGSGSQRRRQPAGNDVSQNPCVLSALQLIDDAKTTTSPPLVFLTARESTIIADKAKKRAGYAGRRGLYGDLQRRPATARKATPYPVSTEEDTSVAPSFMEEVNHLRHGPYSLYNPTVDKAKRLMRSLVFVCRHHYRGPNTWRGQIVMDEAYYFLFDNYFLHFPSFPEEWDLSWSIMHFKDQLTGHRDNFTACDSFCESVYLLWSRCELWPQAEEDVNIVMEHRAREDLWHPQLLEHSFDP